jgi:hypothetical protein
LPQVYADDADEPGAGMKVAPAGKIMASHQNPGGYAQPIVDEWGIYDPDRAGLAAVFEKLDARARALTLPADPRKVPGGLHDSKPLTDRK